MKENKFRRLINLHIKLSQDLCAADFSRSPRKRTRPERASPSGSPRPSMSNSMCVCGVSSTIEQHVSDSLWAELSGHLRCCNLQPEAEPEMANGKRTTKQLAAVPELQLQLQPQLRLALICKFLLG